MPPRFYCDPLPALPLSEATCALDAEESRHARKVLRLNAGDRCELFDGRGQIAQAQILDYVGGQAHCRVLEINQAPPIKPRLTVATAVPKGSRAEDMINQLGQLGVDTFVPIRSARSVVDPGEGKRARYERAALAAAKQSGRATTMQIAPTVEFMEWLTQPTEMGLLLDPRGETAAGTELAQRMSRVDSIAVLIGPEGGWTEAELQQAEAAGYMRWKIGPHVLRIETAAVAAAAVVRQMTL